MAEITQLWNRLRERWSALLAGMVPELEQRLADDARHAPPPSRRWRMGLYSYDESALPAAAQAPVEAPEEALDPVPIEAPSQKTPRDRRTRS